MHPATLHAPCQVVIQELPVALVVRQAWRDLKGGLERVPNGGALRVQRVCARAEQLPCWGAGALVVRPHALARGCGSLWVGGWEVQSGLCHAQTLFAHYYRLGCIM